jgi:hypothetical protein
MDRDATLFQRINKVLNVVPAHAPGRWVHGILSLRLIWERTQLIRRRVRMCSAVQDLGWNLITALHPRLRSLDGVEIQVSLWIRSDEADFSAGGTRARWRSLIFGVDQDQVIAEKDDQIIVVLTSNGPSGFARLRCSASAQMAALFARAAPPYQAAPSRRPEHVPHQGSQPTDRGWNANAACSPSMPSATRGVSARPSPARG